MQPQSETAVKLTYHPSDAGIFRGLIEVKTNAQTLQKQIDVNATSVEFTRFIIDENGAQANQFDFGTFYYGQVNTLQGYLVNNSPKKYKFQVKFRKGLLLSIDEMSSLQTPFQVGLEQTEKIMSCLPSEGIIESYSQVRLPLFSRPLLSRPLLARR